jgi:pyridoxamine 5'-phosphate oxidase
VTNNEHPSLAEMRINYSETGFDVSDLAANWWTQFDAWLADAVTHAVAEPNAMVLATASPDGVPASRNVLAKQVDESGVTFYTNYGSAKSADLDSNPLASVTFSWLPLQRQVHVRGDVRKVDAATTLAYWRTRPRGSQLGAWASPQSAVVADRAALDALQAQVEARFGGPDSTAGNEIPVPPHWGGWRIEPQTVEFWQGRSGRLHDRLRYRRDDGAWIIERLAP